jgi:hypothetical protein
VEVELQVQAETMYGECVFNVALLLCQAANTVVALRSAC